MIQRLLKPIVELREGEGPTVLLMFLYSFLAMTSYTTLKPATRSTFIKDLGADNLPYVLLVAGFLIAFIMQGYTWAVSKLPRKAVIPAAQAVMAGLMFTFYVLFQTKQEWVAVAFYLYGLILGILVISQFWTLANDIFDPRQAKRVFGFIGAGSSLGGIAGSTLAQQAKAIGTFNLLLISGATMLTCMVLVIVILRRETSVQLAGVVSTGEEAGVGAGEAFRLLRSSKHLQIIAAVIAFAAIGAGLIEQQLNMAAEAFRGREADGLTSFLGTVQLWTSGVGFVVQLWLVSKIQRYLGIGFALLILPVSLGTTGIIMLLYAALWAPALARVLDTSLRYTVDKTTREILFLPLPTDLKYQAKPFVDVTVDRFGKAFSALLSLVLIKEWGLHLSWQQISWASLIITALWIATAIRAKRGYLESFRSALGNRNVAPAEMRVQGDLSTIETLIGELADPDETRVLRAIDFLESLEKRNLITPLLLYHESPKVRARALAALGEARPDIVARWQPHVQRMLSDPAVDVRAAAIGALARMRGQDSVHMVRQYIDDRDPRLAASAAAVLAASGSPDDVAMAERALTRLAADTSGPAASGRRDAAVAVRQINDPRFHHVLLPLLYDGDPDVAEEAMRSVRQVGTADFLFVPTLVSLLRNRRLKSAAREVLVGYGESVVDSLAYFLQDPEEDPWVRRHIPATLARIPSQKSLDVLSAALGTETDGFTRFKVISAIGRLLREQPALTFDKKPLDAQVTHETQRYFRYLSLHYNLFEKEKLSKDSLLARALSDKMQRTLGRVWLLIGLQLPWKDAAAARFAVERGDPKQKSSALEYLDNVLPQAYRRRVLTILDEMPIQDRVKKGNVMLSTRIRGTDETLLTLINDEDAVIAAAAVHMVAANQVWSLADDLEHVLAHRDVKDFYVFEAASWALAEHRMPAERRRALWLEPLPAVEIASRLARLPLFRHTTVDELFRVASAGQQARYERGRLVYQTGDAPERMQFLLDGAATVTTSDGASQELAPPAPLGFDEVLQGMPMAETVRTGDTTVCLSLSVEEGRTLLANSTDLVQGLFSTILEHPSFAGRRGVVKGRGDKELARVAADGVTPVEKVLALQRLDLFARFPAEELLQLADIATPVTFSAGGKLFDAGDTPALYLLLDGELALQADGVPALTADAGDAVGVYETLAGVPIGRSASVSRPGAALRLTYDDLFDLLGQRPDLLRSLFGALLGGRAGTAIVRR